MQLRFLETSQLGLRWMMLYYQNNPQLDKARALRSFDNALAFIKTSIPRKKTFAGLPDVWEGKVAYTPFSILYTIRGKTIYVIDVRDQRGNRSAEALRRFSAELAEKYGL
jgi:hypothetical protein